MSLNRIIHTLRQRGVLNVIFLIIAALYFELLLHVLTAPSQNMDVMVTLLFTVSYCTLIALCGLLPIGRIMTVLALCSGTVFFCIQYFLFQSFQTFMGITALTAAGDVVGDFSGTILTMILKGWWVILLFAIPPILYGLFCKKLYGRRTKNYPAVLCYLICFALCYGVGYWSVCYNPTSLSKYRNQYEFSAACQHFGLLTGTRLDLTYLLLGNDAQLQVQEVSIPTEIDDETVEKLPEQAETEQSAPVVYYKNVLEIDFPAINQSVQIDTVRVMNDYISTLPGSSQHEYTGLFEGNNLIFITAEAFSAELLDPELTPTLYRMATQGIQITDYYQPAWGGSTSTGEFSNLTGLIPTKGVSSIQRTADKNMYFTLGNQLQRQDYHSFAYHNNTYTYYDRHLTHNNLGYSTYIGMGTGMEDGVTDCWPQSDLEMVQFTLQDYINAQPFSVYYMSVSGHGTYQPGANAMTAKNWDAVADMDASDTIKGYYAANLELEYAMAYLISKLEQAGIADDTVIVIAPDHYPYALEASDTWGNATNYLPELYGYAADSNVTRDHNALIIWSSGLETQEIRIKIDTPVYSLDIVPTLSNLFGLEYDSRLLVGRDILSDQMPLVIWRDYSWLTDRGYYDAGTGRFIPADDTEPDEAYIASVNAVVQNKYALSNLVLEYDYYGILFGEDTIT